MLFILTAAVAFGNGCAVKRFAVNRFGDALAGGGGVFASDDDPELIRQAVPFGLKLQESLLAESPRHRGLLLSTARGFTQYSYAFVQQDADELEAKDVAGAKALRDRARKLYLRARDYGLRGLGYPKDVKELVGQAKKRDVPLLYWTAAAWGAAISISKDRPDLVAELPQMEALIDRACALDESFDNGAIHSFLISYEMARPGVNSATALEKAWQHFARATQLSAGKSAAPYVAMAELMIRQGNKAKFEELLNTALAIPVEQTPDLRLANLVAQRRAKWLMGQKDDLFAE